MTGAPLFVFKGGRRARLGGGGDIPREFFYGCTELGGSFIEEKDRPVPLPAWLERGGTALLHAACGLNLAALARLAARRDELEAAPVVVATTNVQSLALAALKALGRLDVAVLGVVMGLLPRGAPSRHGAVYRRLMGKVTMTAISKAEAAALGIAYLPFGIDTAFWTPGGDGGGAAEDYVLAVGNDPNRDWACLADAWGPELPALRIVTRRPVPASAGRVEVIAGDWHGQALSDGSLRDLYRGARLVVVPNRDTIQPAGQSVALQAMACGRPVVLSDVEGVWDRPALAEACRLVAPGRADALREAVSGLLSSPGQAEALAARGCEVVRAQWTVEIMARELSALMTEARR